MMFNCRHQKEDGSGRCLQKFKDVEELLAHERKEHGNYFLCYLCEKRFDTLKDLTKHNDDMAANSLCVKAENVLTWEKNNPFFGKCKICNRDYNLVVPKDVKQDKAKKKPLITHEKDFYDGTKKEEKQLRRERHFSTHHTLDGADEGDDEANYAFKCITCNYSTYDSKTLKTHLREKLGHVGVIRTSHSNVLFAENNPRERKDGKKKFKSQISIRYRQPEEDEMRKLVGPGLALDIKYEPPRPKQSDYYHRNVAIDQNCRNEIERELNSRPDYQLFKEETINQNDDRLIKRMKEKEKTKYMKSKELNSLRLPSLPGDKTTKSKPKPPKSAQKTSGNASKKTNEKSHDDDQSNEDSSKFRNPQSSIENLALGLSIQKSILSMKPGTSIDIHNSSFTNAVRATGSKNNFGDLKFQSKSLTISNSNANQNIIREFTSADYFGSQPLASTSDERENLKQKYAILFEKHTQAIQRIAELENENQIIKAEKCDKMPSTDAQLQTVVSIEEYTRLQQRCVELEKFVEEHKRMLSKLCNSVNPKPTSEI